MEYIVLGIFVYIVITAYLQGRLAESVIQDEGLISMPQWLGGLLASLMWPLTLIWYIYDRVSNRRHSNLRR